MYFSVFHRKKMCIIYDSVSFVDTRVVSGGVLVSVQLLDCDCFCPVTPQGGVLWHVVELFLLHQQ